jgi:hypothetical protein
MEDFDIKEFAKMFDAALASDNPTVKKALRNFMLVAAIVTAEDDDKPVAGPLSTLVDEIRRLSQKVSVLESQIYSSPTKSYPAYPYDTNKYTGINPTWIYSPNTSSVSTTSAVNARSYADAENLADLLRDLKFNNE